MHELSIVQSLLGQCERLASDNKAKKVLRVEVSVGRLSGVEAHYLQNAFDAFKLGGVCEEAELVVSVSDVVVECVECGWGGVLAQNEFVCGACGGAALKVTSGEELMLMRVEME